jgi:hypothetical protein
MKAKYFCNDSVATSMLSTSFGSCLSIHRRTQLYFPYLITRKYGGDVNISFAGFSRSQRGTESRASCCQARPRVAAVLGRCIRASFAFIKSKTSMSGGSNRCSRIYRLTYPGDMENVLGILMESPRAGAPGR